MKSRSAPCTSASAEIAVAVAAGCAPVRLGDSGTAARTMSNVNAWRRRVDQWHVGLLDERVGPIIHGAQAAHNHRTRGPRPREPVLGVKDVLASLGGLGSVRPGALLTFGEGRAWLSPTAEEEPAATEQQHDHEDDEQGVGVHAANVRPLVAAVCALLNRPETASSRASAWAPRYLTVTLTSAFVQQH